MLLLLYTLLPLSQNPITIPQAPPTICIKLATLSLMKKMEYTSLPIYISATRISVIGIEPLFAPESEESMIRKNTTPLAPIRIQGYLMRIKKKVSEDSCRRIYLSASRKELLFCLRMDRITEVNEHKKSDAEASTRRLPASNVSADI